MTSFKRWRWDTQGAVSVAFQFHLSSLPHFTHGIFNYGEYVVNILGLVGCHSYWWACVGCYPREAPVVKWEACAGVLGGECSRSTDMTPQLCLRPSAQTLQAEDRMLSRDGYLLEGERS